jgi:hypothetical protein
VPTPCKHLNPAQAKGSNSVPDSHGCFSLIFLVDLLIYFYGDEGLIPSLSSSAARTTNDAETATEENKEKLYRS